MKRQLLALATAAGCSALVGCGSVNGPSPDGSVGGGSDTPDPLTGSLRNGCVLALHMDEPAWTGAAGEVKDACGNNPGKVTGAGTTTVAGGVRGRAGSFSGAGCIDIANATSLHGTTGLTLSAWIFPTQLNMGNDANGVISKRDDKDVNSEFGMSVWIMNNVYVDLDGDSGAAQFNGHAAITTGRWTQLTMVYDGTQPAAQRAKLFVNDSLDVAGSAVASLTPTTAALHIGCLPAQSQGTQQNFIGQMDEVVMWNRALTQQEVDSWYNGTKP